MIRTWRLDDGRQTLALASDGGVPWIDKALRRDTNLTRFDRMAEEGWSE